MDWKSFGRIVAELAPFVLTLVPGVPPMLVPVIVHGIQTAESFGGTGAEKKAVAIELVKTAIQGVNTTATPPGVVVDPNLVHVVSNGIDTVIGVVNAIQRQPIAPDADLRSA